MKKKLLLITAAAIGAFAFAFALAGCNNEQGETACTHEHIEHTSASNSNCVTHGTEEYWYCPDCTTYFTDAGGTAKTTLEAVTKPLGAHSYDTWVNEDPATCSATGTKGHQYCSVCQKNYDQSNVEIADLTIAIDSTAHSYTEQDWIELEPATCAVRGTKGHYHCTDCNKDFDKSGVEIADLTIAIDSTKHVYGDLIPAKEASDCQHPGYEAHYHCDVCGSDFMNDADKTEYTPFFPPFTSPTIPGTHDLTHHAAHTAANCADTEGTHPEYWECSICNKKFDNENGTREFIDYIATQEPHDFRNEDGSLDTSKLITDEDGSKHYHCNTCNEDFDEYGFPMGGIDLGDDDDIIIID